MTKFSGSKYWTRQTQIMICMATCALIYFISSFVALSPIFVLVSVFWGMGIYVVGLLIKRIPDQKRYRKIMLVLLLGLTIVVVASLQAYLDPTHKVVLIVQVGGFMLLGGLLVSLRRHKDVETAHASIHLHSGKR